MHTTAHIECGERAMQIARDLASLRRDIQRLEDAAQAGRRHESSLERELELLVRLRWAEAYGRVPHVARVLEVNGETGRVLAELTEAGGPDPAQQTDGPPNGPT